MPFLALDNALPLFDRIEILGVMFFPKNEDKREQFKTIMRAKIYTGLIEADMEAIFVMERFISRMGSTERGA